MKLINKIKSKIYEYKRFLVIKKFLKQTNIDFKKDKEKIQIFLNLLIKENKLKNIFISFINITITGINGKIEKIDLNEILKNFKKDLFISIHFELEDKSKCSEFITIFKMNSRSLVMDNFKFFTIKQFNGSPEILLNIKN
jgi:hypothetical protein